MLITKEVEVRWHGNNREWYECKGYTFTKMRDSFICKVEDLSDGCNVKVQYLCDYCLQHGTETTLIIPYNSYHNKIIKYGKGKDCCYNCRNKKTKEENFKKYGVDSYAKTEEFKEKIKNTCLEKYGVDSYAKTKDFKEKFKQTCFEKYGVTNPSMLPEVRDKIKGIFLAKYGVESIFESDYFKD